MSEKSSTALFIQKAQLVHKNKYIYDKAIYEKSNVDIIIICKKHGDFIQKPNNHLQGNNCPKCAKINRSQSKTIDQQDFINRACKIHGARYSYKKLKYKGCKTKVIITCPKHGDFLQTPSAHTNGTRPRGCPACRGENISNSLRKPKNKDSLLDKCPELCEEFDLERNKLSPNEIKFGSNDKFWWICNKCGHNWEAMANNRQRGRGCPKCKCSLGEKRIQNFLIVNNIKYVREHKDKNCKRKGLLRFDFAIWINDELKLIEYNGIQHYERSGLFSSGEKFEIIQDRDNIKRKFCEDNKIKLLEISYKDFDNIETIIQDFICKKPTD